jgi:crotonobetainyl-CoA:carnitine CoA-transferase CaiB-like acyl-CoA transferase
VLTPDERAPRSERRAAPLDGIRVLELGTAIAGPYVAELLHLLGAEVIKIERPGGGDPIRQWKVDRGPLPFIQMNAGKRSIALDLRKPEAVGVVKRLVERCDVFVHNARPGWLDKLGLGGADCLKLNPRLVYLAISGFGGVGPLGMRPAYDTAGQAFGGLLGLLSGQGRPNTGPTLADLGTGIVATAGVLAGLTARERTGCGTVVETSLIEGVIALIADLFAHQQALNAEPDFATRARQSQIYPMQTVDQGYIMIHLSTSQPFFVALMTAAGRPDLATDERFAAYDDRVVNHEQLYAELTPAFARRTREEWEKILTEHGVPNSLVLGLGEIMAHPQFEALDLFRDTEPATGLRLVGPPWRFDGHRAGEGRTTFEVGQHTSEILAEFFDADERARLVAVGIGQAPGQ